ncbi:MAG TPA: envelope stress response membrane protein PspC [Desulfobulbaceae bacterium]|nr:envelope stress response membrane protein PspC [Desulfobulbaceae bacterium]
MTYYYDKQGGIYRARDGVFLGVCKGVADYFDFSVFWVRIALVIMFICSGFWPVLGIYLVAAFFMKPEPVRPIASEEEREFYHSYVNSPKSAAQRLKKKFQELDRRIRRMEDEVTGREYEWKRRFDS